MDKKAVIKMLAGTITRGALWITAAAAARFGLEKMDEDAAASVGFFAASVIVAVISAWWSKRKDATLLRTPAD